MRSNLLLILLILSFSFIGKSQNIQKGLSQADIRNALKIKGLEIFKFDFDSIDTDYNLTIHIEEIGNDSVIETKVRNFYSWQKDLAKKNLTIITNKNSNSPSTSYISFIHPNSETSIRFDFSEKFNREHIWKPIKQGKIVYNQKVPLLFYGMMWEDSFLGQKIYRFCWGEDITRKMDNENFNKIEHMLLISYELKK
jgi:hypothetical protein